LSIGASYQPGKVSRMKIVCALAFVIALTETETPARALRIPLL